MFRYIAFAWSSANPNGAHEAQAFVERIERQHTGWQSAFSQPGIKVLCADSKPHFPGVFPLSDSAGVILGTIFKRNANPLDEDLPAIASFGKCESARVVRSNGNDLLNDYWGRYVAFLRNEELNTISVLKDPAGRLPCFFMHRGSLTIFFSCIEDCIGIGLPSFDVNWNFITSRVGRAIGEWGQTGLKDVFELLGGQQWSLCLDRKEIRTLWDPFRFAVDVVEDPIAAARMVRATVRSSAHAWVSSHKSVLCRVSGGLDSTIVLGCLKDAPTKPAVNCITYFPTECRYDDRNWARIAATHMGYETNEFGCDVRVPIEALKNMGPMVSPPVDYSWAMMGDFERELARRNGATAIVTGDGGDCVFSRSGHVFAWNDFRLRHGVRRELLELAIQVALLGNRSVWRVLREALFSHQSNSRRVDDELVRMGRTLVSAEVFNSASHRGAKALHPWFKAPARTHVTDVVEFLTLSDLYYHPLRPASDQDLEPLYPLCSQPVIELCLRIPSYVHLNGGRSRGLARRAFYTDLPEEIRRRQWKDAGQGLEYQLIRKNGAEIRSMLLDGILVERGYLNRADLERSLAPDPSKETAIIHEVTDHLIVETWLQSWTKMRSALAAA